MRAQTTYGKPETEEDKFGDPPAATQSAQLGEAGLARGRQIAEGGLPADAAQAALPTAQRSAGAAPGWQIGGGAAQGAAGGAAAGAAGAGALGWIGPIAGVLADYQARKEQKKQAIGNAHLQRSRDYMR